MTDTAPDAPPAIPSAPAAPPAGTGDRAPGPPDAGASPDTPAVTVEEKVEETSIDHGVEESFPASDPVSVSITKVLKPAS
ncbi:MAG: hypothetical protein PGN26_00060 [Xylophilus ampelinus]